MGSLQHKMWISPADHGSTCVRQTESIKSTSEDRILPSVSSYQRPHAARTEQNWPAQVLRAMSEAGTNEMLEQSKLQEVAIATIRTG